MISKLGKIGAVVITVFLFGTAFLVPAGSVNVEQTENIENTNYYDPEETDLGPFELDRRYIIEDEPGLTFLDDDVDDAGYRRDTGDEISRSYAIFPGEVVDDTPGRGTTGKLHETSDDEDWYFFSACDGQTVNIVMTPPGGFDFDLGLWDGDEVERATSTNSGTTQEEITFTVDYTGKWYMRIHYISGTDEGQYTFAVTMLDQNDAGLGDDAGDDFASADTITEGLYSGYLDMNDGEDWYKFNVNNGNGIHFFLDMKKTAYLTDFDISLYNPSGDYVYEEDYYYDDELWYPCDETGQWRIEIDIFPGWTDIPQPTEWEYYTYGSGAYELEFIIEADAPDPPAPIPQPDITPMAKTFKIANDFESNDDEYGYLASIPACNYLEGGERFLSPIIYEGDDTETNYYNTDADRGDVDDTTQYLVDDWDEYLSQHGKGAVEYNVPSDPIEAAADIATSQWTSSALAVIAVDGSDFEDTETTILQRTRTLNRQTEVETVPNDSPDILDIGGYGYPMNIGPKWCAVNVSMIGTGGATPTLNSIWPHFMPKSEDWWPSPYDGAGDKIDIYYPVTKMGIYTAGTDRITGDWEFEITKYAGHRYFKRITNSDSVLSVKVTTETPSDLLVFLVDPDGHLRSPDIPQWNGPVMPLHVWNGFENPSWNPWRCWDPGLHTEFSTEVLHPEKGWWTIIVVPRRDDPGSTKYTITGTVRTTNSDRAHAAVSAANAAVIASLEHAPLLYVTKDSVPTETASALSTLGVSNVILVGRGGIISNSVKTALPSAAADLTTMQEIIDHIKDYDASENYITITSIKSGDGYFAPSAMIAAYHGSPVLRIGDAPGNPAGVADRIETWRLWEGDYYHGSRSCGHLPHHTEPVPNYTPFSLLIEMIKFFIGGNAELPPFGLDAKRYWNEELHDGIHDWIEGYGLDLSDEEAYCFVSPRKDINLPAHSVMLGQNSYSGHIPGRTVAYISAVVNRNLLYPALIFANPSKDITTSQMMNFPDGGTWKTNDGLSHQIYSSREVKKSFGSHGRTFEGHILWDAHLERMNEGASVMYYSGHGTGGSGISAQYYQTEHCNYPEQIWWDAWRGYNYDTWKTPRYNGRVWYNPDPPMLYDIIHFDYNDELFDNLHSLASLWMSCTTADADGPLVYLDHGAVMYYGNAGSGLCPEADLQDDEVFEAALVYGEYFAKAYSKEVWLHYRDFTIPEGDPNFEATMYGPSSMQVTTVQCIYADPNLIICSPEWISPEPVDA